MLPVLIALTGAIVIYALVMTLCGRALSRRQAVLQRVMHIVNERTETVPAKKTVKRFRRKKKDKTGPARTRRQLEQLENQLYDVGIRLPVQQFLMLWLGITLFLPSLLTLLGMNGLICSSAAVLLAVGPVLYMSIRRKKRRKVLEEQLGECIAIICNALRAGHSFQGAMNNISQEMQGPVAEEFGRVFRETQHGMTMEESMGRMTARVGSEDLDILCTAILIQREVGGNLAEVLENIAGTIASRLSLRAEIKTRTASGRMSGYIVGALPLLLLAAMRVMNPDYCSLLFTTQIGRTLLIVGAVMEVIGFVVIRKIVTIKY